jgi:N-acetylglucosaminyldiphosphoundecaprenol N-acetyl-beta-D-mannosaminyltransferase
MISDNERVTILDCPIDNLTMSETIKRVNDLIIEGGVHQHVVVNVDKLVKLRNDENLKEIISSCDIINADGMPLVWASRFLGNRLKERVTGIDLMERLIKLASKKKYRIFFLGARKNVVKKVVNVFKNKYHNLEITGYRDGYWAAEEENTVARLIKNSKPDILFVAISSPKKEVFLNNYLDYMNVPFVMGVGGSFDVIAGLIKRAPEWMRNSGLEWLYRLVQEPRRMWKRYLIGNSIFIWCVIKEVFRNKYKMYIK